MPTTGPAGKVSRSGRDGTSPRECARNRPRVAWALVSGLLLSLALACTPRSVAETIVLDDRVVRTPNLAFGDDARQTLDVYRARETRRGAPVVVFLYGGRWKYSGKRDYLLVGNALARQGWIAVLPDYRVFPLYFHRPP